MGMLLIVEYIFRVGKIGLSKGNNMPEIFAQSQSPLITPAPVKKGPRGEVTIYATWCKGCRICVEFCPPKVLAMDPGEDHPRVILPDKCTACHFCDTHCPDLAIVIRKLE
jgi:2-oxoglutarate ferredoxin oxidoreductase subunit delta